jgi:Swt1-like HEPN
MTNKQIKRLLLHKLGVTPQALSLQANRERAKLPMTTEEAVYVIAHRNGIPIHRYLNEDQLTKIQQLVSQSKSSSRPDSHAARSKKRVPAPERIIVIAGRFRGTDPILPPAKLAEARRMAAVYPLFYLLENSLREVIKRVMKHHFGENWWDAEMLVNGNLRDIKTKADSRQKKEQDIVWHQRRGSHPIDYTNLEDLPTIASSKSNLFFPSILGEKDSFMHNMKELYLSRNVVGHMGCLDETNISDIEVKVERWQKQMKVSLPNIPE